MCGESWHHQRSLTHHSQFSRLGIRCPALVYVMFMCGRLMGGFLSVFFLVPIWLVCYAHGFHVCTYVCTKLKLSGTTTALGKYMKSEQLM